MSPPDDLMIMTRFVKMLGDRGRLAVLGLLAARPRSREELAQELTASPATLARNLKLLEDAEWIDADEEGIYRLRADALTSLRAALARVEVAPHLATSRAELAPSQQHVSLEPRDALIHAFFDDQGRLRRLPTQKKQRERVLQTLAEENFTLGRSYEEQEVDDLLQPLYGEVDRLRLALVSDGVLVNRNGRYWLSVPK